MKLYTAIDEYIQAQEEEIRITLEQIRRTISEAAPQATELISYGMPAFKQNAILVYFAAFKNHIGFYCLPSGNKAFQKELKEYNIGKGAIQFLYNKPIPYSLIRKIVKFRLKEDVDAHKK
ncbi:MAG: DUF1801 domain-containing protein [Ginsengibacter sp.]